jgi:hypothetical protein
VGLGKNAAQTPVTELIRIEGADHIAFPLSILAAPDLDAVIAATDVAFVGLGGPVLIQTMAGRIACATDWDQGVWAMFLADASVVVIGPFTSHCHPVSIEAPGMGFVHRVLIPVVWSMTDGDPLGGARDMVAVRRPRQWHLIDELLQSILARVGAGARDALE